jgi:glycosyltransferase involved in cell wall biosynthesis
MARVLVVSNFHPPHHYGGYELSCRDVVARWRQRGHDVTVLSSSVRLPGVADDEAESRATVRRDLHVSFADGQFTPPPIRARVRKERANQAALLDAVASSQPDVVSVWHMAGMSSGLLLALCRLGLPIVCVVCDEWPGYVVKTDAWMKLWYRWPNLWGPVERVTGVPTGVPRLAESASFCFVSHDLRDRCLKSSPWFFPRSTVTYSGIDSRDFPVEREGVSKGWSWRLMTAGRLDPRKGFATAIEALRYLPAQSTLEVFAPVASAYQIELEAIGLVPLEAMACGTPVVATGTGGSGEFLIDGINSLLYAAGEARALARALRQLASSDVLREQLVHAGWETAEQLTVDRLTDVLEEWHLAAISEFRDGAPAPRDLGIYREPSTSIRFVSSPPRALGCL